MIFEIFLHFIQFGTFSIINKFIKVRKSSVILLCIQINEKKKCKIDAKAFWFMHINKSMTLDVENVMRGVLCAPYEKYVSESSSVALDY